ncbi:MAG: alpha-(1-_3)-arabinofuranosyltransferase family protein [Acidimicrobiia bacterium]
MTAPGTATERRSTTRSLERGARRGSVVETVLLALLAYMPFLLSSPGELSSDTKQYLYLDPGRFFERVPYLWDSHVGLGTVPHQQIGYLFPMGPYYWLMDAVGFPDWVAQRIWFGSISFAAVLGARWLFRELGIARSGALVGALVYMLTPYQLAFTGRLSVLLLAWAGLPWLVGLAMRATRVGGWRDPAIFALIVLTIGSTNASALQFVLFAPILWIVVEMLRGRESFRRALPAGLRISVLTIGVSLWWILALRTQAVYGLPLLDLTETVKTVAVSSTPLDLLRGLGNWFFYGRDHLGETLEQAPDYSSSIPVLITSFAVPVLALAAAAVVRWRHRAYFALLVVFGTVLAVGAWPYSDPSPFGRVFRFLSESTAVGNSLRNTPRAVPLVALGIAALLGAAVSTLTPKWRELGGALVVAVMVFVAFLPVWSVGYLSSSLSRDEELPDYWLDAARALDADGDATRVLEIPGENFTAYRWGNTNEPITPGIMDRDFVAREVLPLGQPGTVDLLDALDRRIQEGTFEPDSLAALARLMGVGTVVLRSDLEYERFDTARPRPLWNLLTDPVPTGLGTPKGFGAPTPNVAPPGASSLDAIDLRSAGEADPPPVALFPVKHAVPIVRTAPRKQSVLLSGDGDGIVDAAAAGLIDGTQLVLETAALSNAELREALAAGADVVLTDSNRRRSQNYFDRIRDAVGATEGAGASYDDFRLETFPGTGDDARTVAEQRVATVEASGYVTPSDRPAFAFDGDLRTAWLVDAHDADGATIKLHVDDPVPAEQVTLVQRGAGPGTQSISSATIRVNGGEPTSVTLGPESFTAEGQVVPFAAADVRDLELEITGLHVPEGAPDNGVGFAEIGIDDTRVDEVIRLPIDLDRRAGTRLDGHRVDIVLSRQRYEQALRNDDELAMSRRVVLPDARTFGLTGTARVNANAPDSVIDAVLGTTALGAVFSSDGHLRGDVDSRASRAFDDDPSTAWTSSFGPQGGRWVEAALGAPTTFEQMSLTYLDDGSHAVPTQVHLEADGVPVRTMTVMPDAGAPGAATRGDRRTATFNFDPFVAQRVRLVVDAVRQPSLPPASGAEAELPTDLPVSLAEVTLPGVPVPATPGAVPSECRADLVVVDGSPVPVRLSGAPADARSGLAVEACEPSVGLDAGSTTVTTSVGLDTGVDVDRLVLSSGRDGQAAPVELLGAPRSESGAKVRIVSEGPTSYDLKVATDGTPFWLVLGQSQSDGWEASVEGASIGMSTMVDGYANGWKIRPSAAGTIDISLRWTPQSVVWVGIALSIAAVLACLTVVALTWRRRRAQADAAAVTLMSAPEAQPASRYVGGAPSVRATVVLALGAAVGAALVSRWWIGLVVGAATALAGTTSRGRILLSGGAPVALAIGALFDVPELGWLAVTLLAADVVLGWWRERATRRNAPDAEEPEAEALELSRSR